jgi:HK97 family phage major capsid protein
MQYTSALTAAEAGGGAGISVSWLSGQRRPASCRKTKNQTGYYSPGFANIPFGAGCCGDDPPFLLRSGLCRTCLRKEKKIMDNNKMPMNKRSEYDYNFWNHIKGIDTARTQLYDPKEEMDPGVHQLPIHSEEKYEKAVSEKSIMRRLATVVSFYRGIGHIVVADSDDTAEFIPEGQPINIKNVMDDFSPIPVLSHKLAVILKMPSEFVSDAAFDLKGYMVKKLAKSYAATEDNAFINGSGEHEPEGVLRGAETGCEESDLTYDGIIRLFYSVKPEYRETAHGY